MSRYFSHMFPVLDRWEEALVFGQLSLRNRPHGPDLRLVGPDAELEDERDCERVSFEPRLRTCLIFSAGQPTEEPLGREGSYIV